MDKLVSGFYAILHILIYVKKTSFMIAHKSDDTDISLCTWMGQISTILHNKGLKNIQFVACGYDQGNCSKWKSLWQYFISLLTIYQCSSIQQHGQIFKATWPDILSNIPKNSRNWILFNPCSINHCGRYWIWRNWELAPSSCSIIYAAEP